ncbi:MAG: PAS domain S-box protein [Methanomicrobiales archaeon]|nr:PAS domain S-box protein [Methanomicrobiales archaeon]
MQGGSPGSRPPRALTKKRLFDLSIIISALAALGIALYCFSIGFFIIVPHLFYIPIILVAYQYPKRAVAFVGVLAAGYFAEVLLFSPGNGVEIANALLRIMVFFIVAIVISNLSSRLQVRESRYRGIFETSGAGIFLFSPRTGEIEEMNQQCAAMLGYPEDEALSLEVPRIWPGYTGLTGALEAGRLEGLDCNLVARDGTPSAVLLSASLLPDQQEGCVVVTGTAELKRMENHLRRSEETLRVILDTTDVGLLLTDPGRVIVDVNAAAIRFFGGTGREDLIGLNPYDLVAERDREAWAAYRERALNGEAHVSGECTLHRLDGTEWPAEITITHFAQGGAAPGRLVVSLRDITERRRAEKEMREEIRRLFITNEVIAAATASHRLDDLLPAALAKTLALLDLDIGAVHLLYPGEDHARLRASVGADNFKFSVRRDELPYRHVLTDGEARFVDRFHESYQEYDNPAIRSFAVVPIPGDNGPVGCIMAANRMRETIPENERLILTAIGEGLGNAVVKGMLHEDLEAALASANRYLDEANSATETANLYVDILMHDINNANAAAMGYLQMALESEGDPPRAFVRKSFAAIYQSSDIIRNVSTIRRLKDEPAALRPVQIEPVIRGMCSYFVDTSITWEGPDVTVLADDLLDEIFSNLIGNSVKFGGPDVRVTIGVLEEGDTVSVTVADTGPGIPDDLKSRIFERKERGVTKKSGKGLGLYIVRMLAERYGGSVRAGDRVPGHPREGAVITLTLPRYHPDMGAGEAND